MEKYINPYTDLDWDIANGMDAAEKKGIEKGEKIGMEKGRAEGIIETARNAKALNLPIETIVQLTGLTPGKIAAIQPENK